MARALHHLTIKNGATGTGSHDDYLSILLIGVYDSNLNSLFT